MSSVSAHSALGVRPPGDAGAGAEAQPPPSGAVALGPERADADGELRRPRSASTQPTAPQYGPRGDRLEVGDGLQRAVTWARRRPSPGGKVAAKSSAQPTPGRSSPGHRRDEVHQPGCSSGAHRWSTRTVPGPAHVRQVVADEVDDHDVLGVVLGQHGRRGVVAVPLIGRDSSRVAVAQQEELGRGADDVEPRLGHVDAGGVRRGVAPREQVRRGRRGRPPRPSRC